MVSVEFPSRQWTWTLTIASQVPDAFEDPLALLQQRADTFYALKTVSNPLPAYLALKQAQTDFSKDCNVDGHRGGFTTRRQEQ